MFCKSCGKQIDNDSVFCSYCGTRQSPGYNLDAESEAKQSNLQYQNGTPSLTTKTNANINSEGNIVRQTKYDLSYKKEDDALTTGIILLIVSLIFAFVPIKFEDRESYGQFRAISAILSLVLRIIVTIWAVNIAKRQNRETFGWGAFAFFLPSIALIVIATRKKLFANIQINEGLNNEQNSNILSDKALEFYNDSKYSECIRFAEKAIELNPNNQSAIGTLKKARITFSNDITSNTATRTVYRETKDNKLLKIISKNNETIGADVFIEEIPAPDGIYYYLSGAYKIIIKDGKIKERFFIERYKNIVIEQTQQGMPTKGDYVYLENGQPAPTGKYRMGFLASKLIVDNGKFVKYE